MVFLHLPGTEVIKRLKTQQYEIKRLMLGKCQSIK